MGHLRGEVTGTYKKHELTLKVVIEYEGGFLGMGQTQYKFFIDGEVVDTDSTDGFSGIAQTISGDPLILRGKIPGTRKTAKALVKVGLVQNSYKIFVDDELIASRKGTFAGA